MADYKYHQHRWDGTGHDGSYGQGGLPVFTSREAERLVKDGRALGDPQGRDLIERTVRDPFKWRTDGAAQNGHHGSNGSSGSSGAGAGGLGGIIGQGAFRRGVNN